MHTLPPPLNRRRFLRESFAWSALAAARPLRGLAAPPDSRAHHLLLVGDWGTDHLTDAQGNVASAMQRYASAERINTEAVFSLGDNWYGDLPGGATSPRWKTHFEQMYPASAFPGPIFAIAGNHDYELGPESKIEAQLAYAARAQGTRWTMPARWYRFVWPRVDPLMTVIALDSNLPETKSPREAPQSFTLTEAQVREQEAWLRRTLLEPLRTPFLAVMAHHPVYSNSNHGDTPVLIERWDPLLRAHGVHLYLNGHDHDLQHIEFEGHPTSFVTSGGGGRELNYFRKDPFTRGPWGSETHGFSHLELTPARLSLRHIDSTGEVLHSFSKTPAGKLTVDRQI